jgi:hypothetical protein
MQIAKAKSPLFWTLENYQLVVVKGTLLRDWVQNLAGVKSSYPNFSFDYHCPSPFSSANNFYIVSKLSDIYVEKN